MIRDEDFRIDRGSATGPGGRACSFLRMIHLPSGVERIQTGLQGLNLAELRLRWRSEIEGELSARAARTSGR
jgi:hypothetical protein